MHPAVPARRMIAGRFHAFQSHVRMPPNTLAPADRLTLAPLDGRVVLITGATGGVGRALSLACARAGATVDHHGSARSGTRERKSASYAAGSAGDEHDTSIKRR